jgi:hypothetical protein
LTTIIRNPEEAMADINAALTASKEAIGGSSPTVECLAVWPFVVASEGTMTREPGVHQAKRSNGP